MAALMQERPRAEARSRSKVQCSSPSATAIAFDADAADYGYCAATAARFSSRVESMVSMYQAFDEPGQVPQGP